MRKGSKGILSLYAVGIVLLVILVGWIWRDVRSSRVEITADQRIDITPEQIHTIRKGIFSDDHLVRIYYGTMRLGINLKQVESGWISTNGDTLNIMLPQIALLDKDFIDEARTKSFFESGSWSPKDREAMMRRAYQRMLQRGLTPQNLEAARVNGDAQVRQVMQGMGFKHVKIQYKD